MTSATSLLSRILGVLVLLAAPSVAWAANWNVSFCGKYSVQFSDASTSLGDDFLRSNVDLKARGAMFRVYDVTDSALVGEYFSDCDGSTPGCTEDISLDSTHSYRVTLKSRAYVSGNYINVLDDPSTRALYGHVGLTDFSPTEHGSEEFDTPIRTWWNIAAVASFAMNREPAGLSGEGLNFFPLPCPGSSTGSCVSGGEVYIDVLNSGGPSAEEKYLVGHEMGHLVQYKRNNEDAVGPKYDAPLDTSDTGWGRDCYTNASFGHEMNQEEYQSAAALEGYAHFYSAAVFNDADESDCVVKYYKDVDWDVDEDVDDRITDCEDAPNSGLGLADADYFGDLCNADSDTNRGVEYDWLRHLWDLRTDDDVDVETIFDIWVAADPDTWCQRDLDTADPLDPCADTGVLAPYRFSTGADTLGLQSTWDDQAATNGVDR